MPAVATPRAGPVTRAQREQAERAAADADYFARLGRAAATRTSRRILEKLIEAYRAGKNPAQLVPAAIAELRADLVRVMLAGRLKGIERSIKAVPRTFQAARPRQTAYDGAIRAMEKRLRLPEKALAKMASQMDAHVVRVLDGVGDQAQRSLMETMSWITTENLHVRDGVAALRGAWNDLGLTEKNSFQLEAVYRTQTQLAYAAGRAEVESKPAVRDYLWGYKYITADDDRVRPSHMAMDGVTLPKDDPFWRTNKPPNGWSCRCQLIPLYDEEEVVEPPIQVTDERGREVRVGADKGFEFDPGKMLKPTTGPDLAMPGDMARPL